MDGIAEAAKNKRFLWGVLLAWVPLVFFILIPVVTAVREISAQKATGLGAVAGGLSEVFVTFGMASFLTVEGIAIVLLLRTFSKGHPVRAFFSVVSICCCALTLSVFAFLVWQFVRLSR